MAIEDIGVRAVVENTQGYLNDLGRVQSATDKTTHGHMEMGKAFTRVAAVGAAAFTALAVASFKLGEEFNEARKTIIVGTGATGAQLAELQKSFRNVVKDVPTDFAAASTAIADISTRTGLTGKTLETASKQALEFTRLFGGDLQENVRQSTRILGDWGIPAEDMGTLLDRIATASQVTGVNVNQLMGTVVQFGAPLRAMNFSFEESIALLSKWEQEGVNTELVLGSLRIAMGNFARDNVPMREGLEETFAEIQRLGPSAEATALAMEVFGARAGPDMAAAILEGRFAIDDLVVALSDSDGKVTETAAATEKGAERMTKAFNRAKLFVEPLTVAIFDLGGPAIDGLVTAAENLISTIQDVTKFFLENRLALDALTSLLAGAAIAAVIVLTPAIIALGVAAAGAAIAVAAAALPFLALAAVIGAVILAGKLVVENWGLITFAAQTMVALVGHLFSELGTTVSTALSGFLDIGRSIVDGMLQGIREKWDGLVSNVMALVNKLPEGVRKLLGISSPSRVFAEIGEQMMAGLAQGIIDSAEQVQAALQELLAPDELEDALRHIISTEGANAAVNHMLRIGKSAEEALSAVTSVYSTMAEENKRALRDELAFINERNRIRFAAVKAQEVFEQAQTEALRRQMQDRLRDELDFADRRSRIRIETARATQELEARQQAQFQQEQTDKAVRAAAEQARRVAQAIMAEFNTATAGALEGESRRRGEFEGRLGFLRKVASGAIAAPEGVSLATMVRALQRDAEELGFGGVDVAAAIGRVSMPVGSVTQPTSTATTFNVTANYTQPEDPQSIRADLEVLTMMAGT